MVVMALMLAACTSSASRPTTTTSPTMPTSVPVTLVKTTVVAKGQFSGLVSGGGWLYSVQLAQHGPQLARNTVVRLDPASGRIVARSAILPGAFSPTFVDNTLWLIAGFSKGRGLPTGLVALDPMTLRQERFVPESSSPDSLTGSGRGPLWAALGCKLVRLDPRSGRSLQVVTVHGGTQCETVMDNEGQRLFVEVGPEAFRGQPLSPTLLLQERDGSNGRLIGSAIIPNPPNGGVWLSADNGNVWASGGDPGVCGSIYDYRISPLRLFSSSYGHDCQTLPSGVDGGPGASLPNTDQFPLVDISGGVVWVTSAGGTDCFNIRLADGGALVTFAVFEKVVVHVQTGNVVVQPSDRSALGVLLPPGNYSSITMLAGDMGVAIVPPSGSLSPIEVIGQASEDLTETGVPGSGSSGSAGSGGLVDASSIAKRVDSGLVDINTTLNYENEEAAGTGMVLTSNGEVLTNNHVIEGATSISVTDVGNGRTYGARFVGYDRTSDIAVLQLEKASGLKTVSLGNSSGVSSGEAVVGIGNAGGSGGTPSYAGGSVIALDQSITASDQGDGTSENLTGLIETNADIQPGDSGGPLVNSSGKVIGMDTAASAGFSFEQGGSSATQGFSIPIGTALKIAGEITSGDSSSTVHVGPTSFLGVSVVSAGGGASGAFGTGGSGFGQPVPTQTSSGAEIASVVPGSPASQAGLAEGDTITSLGGQSVTSPDLLTTIVENEKPSTSVPLVYVDSSGTRQTVTVQLESGPPQ